MAFVQAQSVGTTGASQTSVITPAMTTTAGNLLVAMASYNAGHTGAVNTPTSSQSDSFARPTGTNAPPYTGTAVATVDFWLATAKGGSTTFTFSWTSGTNGVQLIVFELSGRSGAVTQMAHASDTSFGTSHTGASVTAATGDDVLAFFVGQVASAAFSAGSGFTIPTNGQVAGGTNVLNFAAEYKAGVAAGAISPTWTTSSSDEDDSYSVALAQASAMPDDADLGFTKFLEGNDIDDELWKYLLDSRPVEPVFGGHFFNVDIEM